MRSGLSSRKLGDVGTVADALLDIAPTRLRSVREPRLDNQIRNSAGRIVTISSARRRASQVFMTATAVRCQVPQSPGMSSRSVASSQSCWKSSGSYHGKATVYASTVGFT